MKDSLLFAIASLTFAAWAHANVGAPLPGGAPAAPTAPVTPGARISGSGPSTGGALVVQPDVAATPSPEEALSRSQVLDAQRALSANGFAVSQDGIAGPSTRSAIRRFQAQRGIPATGELDSRTLRELSAATQSGPGTEQKAGETPATF